MSNGQEADAPEGDSRSSSDWDLTNWRWPSHICDRRDTTLYRMEWRGGQVLKSRVNPPYLAKRRLLSQLSPVGTYYG